MKQPLATGAAPLEWQNISFAVRRACEAPELCWPTCYFRHASDDIEKTNFLHTSAVQLLKEIEKFRKFGQRRDLCKQAPAVRWMMRRSSIVFLAVSNPVGLPVSLARAEPESQLSARARNPSRSLASYIFQESPLFLADF